MYYFVFEMMFIVAILKSDCSDELKKRKRYIFIMRRIAAFNFIFIMAPISIGIIVITEVYPQLHEENLTLLRGMLVARGISRLSVDIPLLYQFIKCFFFFLYKKQANDNRLSTKHKVIMAWTVLLWLLRFYLALCLSTVHGIYYAYTDLSDDFIFLYKFSLLTLYWITDLLTAFTLAYLFYC